MSGTAISRVTYLGSAGLMGAGAALFYLGLVFPAWLLPALALHLAGWVWAVVALAQVVRRAKAQDKRQPWLTWWALSLGAVGEGLFIFATATDSALAFTAAASVALWLFLTPLFLGVCHRMVPWFTSRVVTNYVVVRPYAPLWAMLAACLAHTVLDTAGAQAWLWLADLPLTVLTLWFISRWGIARSVSVRLLAMLHIAFVWAAIAFALYTVSSLSLWLGFDWDAGRAPVHALGMGFFGAMLVGMASRVSLGHSGRPLACDAMTWWLFWGVQLGAVLRLLPELSPVFSYDGVRVSGGVWLLIMAIWAAKYAPMTWQARRDGRPG
ncbi:MAG: NnrS family protein [Betaproteobacteria bacterium]|nr:MAG: NnrS family protein [Betaproteobacteria bacterium]